MALQSLSASELAGTRTVLRSFLGETVQERKTVRELLEMYRERAGALPAEHDGADDLRVDRFIDDMAGDGWGTNVVVRLGVFDEDVLIVDGIHRGIAYLACVEEGMTTDRLPPLHVDC
jgi:hypothetical protein